MEENKAPEIQKYYKTRSKWWVYLIIYGVEFLVATGLCFLTLWLRNFFTVHYDKATTYRFLADAFTIPGIVFILIGVLVILSVQGAFDGLGYVMRRLFRSIFPFIVKTDETYYDYLERRRATRR